MRTVYNKLSPYLLIIFGMILLFIMGQAIPAGVCFLIAYVIIIERIWPEKWGIDEKK